MTGAVLIESIFAWPGIGRYAFRAATFPGLPGYHGGQHPYSPLSMFMVNFLVDILYYFLDPRIRVA